LAEKSERFVLTREFLFEPGNVIEEALACEAKKIESELRILKIQLLHLLVTRRQYFAILNALNGLGATVARREETEIAEDLTGWKVDTHFTKAIPATDAVVHCIGHIAFTKYDVTLAEAAPGHKRL
jgi:hypothetical protein